MSERWKVVIVGGGLAGSAAQHLNSSLVDVTLIDRRNYHLFQPPLYQVATGSLSPGEIASARARWYQTTASHKATIRRSFKRNKCATEDHAADVVVTSAMPCNSATDEKSGMRPDQTLPFEPFSLCELLRFPRSVSCDFYFLINRLSLRLH